MKIYPLDDEACSVDYFRPEATRSLIFFKHSSCHFNQSPVLSFDDTILLRSIRSRQLVSNTKFIKIIIKTSVFELGSIITLDVFDLDAKVRRGP